MYFLCCLALRGFNLKLVESRVQREPSAMRSWFLVLPVAVHAVALKHAAVAVVPGSGFTGGYQPMEQWRHQHEAALSQTARSSLTAYRRTLKANLHRHRVVMHVDKTKLSGPLLDLGNMAQLICGICINLSLVACMMKLGVFI